MLLIKLMSFSNKDILYVPIIVTYSCIELLMFIIGIFCQWISYSQELPSLNKTKIIKLLQ